MEKSKKLTLKERMRLKEKEKEKQNLKLKIKKIITENFIDGFYLLSTLPNSNKLKNFGIALETLNREISEVPLILVQEVNINSSSPSKEKGLLIQTKPLIKNWRESNISSIFLLNPLFLKNLIEKNDLYFKSIDCDDIHRYKSELEEYNDYKNFDGFKINSITNINDHEFVSLGRNEKQIYFLDDLSELHYE